MTKMHLMQHQYSGSVPGGIITIAAQMHAVATGLLDVDHKPKG